MGKRLVAIYSVSVVAVVLLAILVPSCIPPERCTIEVRASLDGSLWTGAVQYKLTGPGGAISGDVVPETSRNVHCGNWTCSYISGGPGEAYLNSIMPSPSQSVSEGGTITFTLEFKTILPETGTIQVKATICGISWEGTVQYTLTESGGSPINGTEVPDSFTADCGNWTCASVSGGPPEAYLDSITPSAPQSVSADETITFTLNFELDQDAAIEFLAWAINGTPIHGREYEAAPCQIIDVHFRQNVDGCSGYHVAVNETSRLTIRYDRYEGLPPAPPVFVNVRNDLCAVVKMPLEQDLPLEKKSQVASFDGEPVEPGEELVIPFREEQKLDVEIAWELSKEIDYTKSINWFGISTWPFEPPGHECVLFELILPGRGVYHFTLTASAEVKLADDEDVNPWNNHAESLRLSLIVVVPEWVS